VAANCYLIGCEETKIGAIIDPGDAAKSIIKMIGDSGLKIEYIINTHGHVDHIGANKAVKDATGSKVLIHSQDAKMLTSSAANFSMFMGHPMTSAPADRLLEEGDVINVGNIALEVLHTPGHTPGGICLKTGNIVFSGDTLFYGSIGRTDFPGGSFKVLIKSIKEKLLVLPDETVVYPGHGTPTSIAFEKECNPFL
jgi:glyoxylase-like metal-dependent hydrolase (beta-lactamase superfamily II)